MGDALFSHHALHCTASNLFPDASFPVGASAWMLHVQACVGVCLWAWMLCFCLCVIRWSIAADILQQEQEITYWWAFDILPCHYLSSHSTLNDRETLPPKVNPVRANVLRSEEMRVMQHGVEFSLRCTVGCNVVIGLRSPFQCTTDSVLHATPAPRFESHSQNGLMLCNT